MEDDRLEFCVEAAPEVAAPSILPARSALECGPSADGLPLCSADPAMRGQRYGGGPSKVEPQKRRQAAALQKSSSKLTERSGDVIENKGQVWKT